MLYLIDGNPLLYRAADRIMSTVPADSCGGYLLREAVAMVNDMLRRHGPGEIIMVFDGGRGFRKELYPEYKTNRDDLTDETQQLLRARVRNGLRTAGDFFDALNANYVRVPGVEADDILSIAAGVCRAEGREALVVSEDRDLNQVLGGPVSALRLREERIVDAATALADWQGDPVRFVIWKALAGDAGDNIKLFDGIGEKRALELVSFCGRDWRKLFTPEAAKLYGKTKWFKKTLAPPDAPAKFMLALRLVATASDYEHLCPPGLEKTGFWFAPTQVREALTKAFHRLTAAPHVPPYDVVTAVRKMYEAYWLPYDLSPLRPFRVSAQTEGPVPLPGIFQAGVESRPVDAPF